MVITPKPECMEKENLPNGVNGSKPPVKNTSASGTKLLNGLYYTIQKDGFNCMGKGKI